MQNRTAEETTDVVTISLDPSLAHEGYAAARAAGAVARVAFASAEASNDHGADGNTKDFQDFLAEPHLFVSRYDEVLSALVDSRLSSDRRRAMTEEQRKKLPPIVEEFRLFSESLIAKDPPDHTRLRKLIQPSFSPRVMASMRPRIQQIADELLDKAELEAHERHETAPERHMDLIAAFAYPLPVTVISEMLGIPLEDRKQVQHWTENLLRADRRRFGQMDEETRARLREFTSYLRALFKIKRVNPARDMISQLLQAEEEGDKLDEDDVLSTVFLLYLAGHVTTVNLIGNGVLALLMFPTELEKLRNDPQLAPKVVEETLRYWGPVDFLGGRIAKETFEFGKTTIPQGEPVMIGLASANRDAARFPNPDAYDITRDGAERHVAFGKGIHLCVGAPLARIEGHIAFETLIRRLPALRLGVAPEDVQWNNSFLRGLVKLPVLF